MKFNKNIGKNRGHGKMAISLRLPFPLQLHFLSLSIYIDEKASQTLIKHGKKIHKCELGAW